MGLHSNGSFATVWEVKPVSDMVTRARISVSKKDKNTGEYTTEFEDFVAFIGSANAAAAAKLKEKDRIKITSFDVRNEYNHEKKMKYYNFAVFGFEKQGEGGGSTPATKKQAEPANVFEADVAPEPDLPF